jgi:cell division GTPase FtsZ
MLSRRINPVSTWGRAGIYPNADSNNTKLDTRVAFEVRSRGVRLRPDLYAGVNPVIGRTAAENAEREIAAGLKRAGFAVIYA